MPPRRAGERGFTMIELIVVLAIIVLIRTFLSFALEVELEGRWPWQRSPDRRQKEDGNGRRGGIPVGDDGTARSPKVPT